MSEKLTKEALVDKVQSDGISDFLLFGFDPEDFEGTDIEHLTDAFTVAKEALEEAIAEYEKVEEEVDKADFEEYGDWTDENGDE